MQQRHQLLTAIIAATLLVTACARHTATPRAPQTLASPLRDLTRALRTEMRDHDNGFPNDALLQAVFTSRPALKTAFTGIPININRSAKDLVVLICTPDGKYATHEDASWTPMIIDRLWYTTEPAHPCAFDPLLDPNNPKEQR